jgi:hypothetical protein
MILSAHQPAFIPWLGYLHRIAISDKFVILDNVQFEKNSFTNRNKILGSNGPLWVTVPCSLKGHIDSKIKDIKIPENKWKKKVSRTISQSYCKSPFYDEHWPFFENIFSKDWNYIAQINQEILSYLLKVFQIDTPLYNQSELPTEGSKQELIISLCQNFKADTFIFGAHGKNYVEQERFSKAGVTPKFHHYQTVKYPQKTENFVSNLSSLDVLFNVSSGELPNLLHQGGRIEL